MKKLFLSLFFACLSSLSYAELYPEIHINQSDCSPNSSHNLTICFYNNLNTQMDQYALQQTLIYEDGSSIENISNLSGFSPQFFTVVSTSTAQMKKEKIVSAWYSIIEGDAYRYHVVAGCNMEITPVSISHSVLRINKVGNNLFCR